jgi:hypothetical protein
LTLSNLPASAQSDRRSAAEAYARIVDYPLLIERAATQRAAELPAAERAAFVAFITRNVDFEMTRFYAISAMVDLFEVSELQALASFAGTPEAPPLSGVPRSGCYHGRATPAIACRAPSSTASEASLFWAASSSNGSMLTTRSTRGREGRKIRVSIRR